MYSVIINLIVALGALATVWDIFFGRGKYLRILWHWLRRQVSRIRFYRARVELVLPQLASKYAPVFPEAAIPLDDVDRTRKELLKHIMRGAERLLAYRLTRDGFGGFHYLVEWQRPNLSTKSCRTQDRAVANEHWREWYLEWKNRPGGFGGSFGTGLDGSPPF